ncbi:MAG: sulfatase-like hydrolase/transferase, partial [Cytophagaceae bacterium]|nr:sulfatase-like hydrolase/transferase [Gemmatimonadaceae bacterium]
MTSSPSVETHGSIAPGQVRFRGLVLRSLAFGGLAGAAHVAFASRRFYLKGDFAWASRDLIWMSPVANAVLLVALSVVLWGIGKASSGRIRQGTLEGVLAGVAVLAILLLLGGLHVGATLLFAVGLGVQHARMVHRGSRLVTLSTVSGIGLFVALLAGGLVERATRDARARTIATSAAPAGAPNVVVILWDTVRAMSLSLYGAPRQTTPELARLATRATTFDWAIAPSPWTLPSHCSMFTGLQPGEHSCRW